MKTAITPLIDLLNNSQQAVFADLYTITLADATVLRYTNAGSNITWSANVYESAAIARGTIKETIGVEVSTLEVHLFFGINDLVMGVPWPQFARNGGLDGASIRLDKLFAADWNSAPVGAVYRFSGRVSDVTPSRTEITVIAKSDMELLNVQMPRNLYKPSCNHALYDTGCALTKSTYAATSSALVGSTDRQLLCSLAQAAGYFDQGTITCTSGANNGISRTIKSHTAGILNLSIPLPNTPAPGDAFSAYPGCDKTLDTCINKFSNKVHFRGFPYVPVPETAL